MQAQEKEATHSGTDWKSKLSGVTSLPAAALHCCVMLAAVHCCCVMLVSRFSVPRASLSCKRRKRRVEPGDTARFTLQPAV